jgi:ornithine cyclodeaminase/alanine dehydrogenase-like protein (mu-crystallin family)
MRHLDAVDLLHRLPVTAAIDALEAGFREGDPSVAPLRSHLETPAGTLLQMPAFGDAGVGVKLVTLTPANAERGLPFINAVYVLFDGETQVPDAIVDGAALTALRTAAVSGLATRHLANAHARRLVIFGAGVQARSHLEAMLAVRPIEHAIVVSRTPARAQALAETARGLGIDAAVGEAGDVADADIVCTCTTSDVPLFDGGMLAPGTHVNAVGSYRPAARELDTVAMTRARVVVETRDAAFEEAGELCIPIGEGVFGRDHVVADLAQVVHGTEVRTSADDITIFKSVGLAFEDLIVARAAVDAPTDGAQDTG